jgi:uncharacterized glyoxalase superfamily protein PhnB/ketosteroid isomerase-like protein
MTELDNTGTNLRIGPAGRVWPILSYRDAPAAIAFLGEAFGFEPRAVYPRDGEPGTIEHAELGWPGGGGIMLGTAGKDDTPFGRRMPGNDAVYVVCDDPDTLFQRATTGHAEIVRGLADEDYGSRGFTARDPEGNLWSFGTYAGEAVSDAGGIRQTRRNGGGAFAALLDDWNEAIVANDPDAIGRFADPDWVFVGADGVVPGAQFLESVATGRVTHDFMTSDLHSARVLGDVAVVIARVRNSGTFDGTPFQLDEWTTDVFVRRDGGWRCLLTHLTAAAR